MRGRGEPVPVVVAPGDGIGPEIMAATLSVLEAAGASLDLKFIEVRRSVYRHGYASAIATES